MTYVRRVRDWLFALPEGERTTGDIVLWWELRRIPYNVIVGAYGLCSFVLFCLFLTLSGELRPGEDYVEPAVLIVAPFILNVCYSMGAILELILDASTGHRAPRTGPAIFKFGLAFSLLVASFPAVFWALICARNLVR